MARVALAAVLLMQCCNVILAARPLLDGAGRYAGAGALIMQVLDSSKRGCSGPGRGNNGGWQDPSNPGC
ncbi:hypothetical protein SETIT_9G530100v2 [Setaria italica]|uniref:Uncharacterized protein n=2 Tax=Setaria TaxID=4554 RepID=A0A368SVJ0_SETIT|nr:hypothetical protein SETIT_9G530100v2 [Setaria italica]TKV98046.1 hypothetical protein SEVIR_9G534600v2 [Setaria viridis]